MPVRNDNVPLLWIQERLCSGRSERVIKRRSEALAFAIGYCLRVNHLPVLHNRRIPPPNFQRFQEALFSREPPRVMGNKTRSR